MSDLAGSYAGPYDPSDPRFPDGKLPKERLAADRGFAGPWRLVQLPRIQRWMRPLRGDPTPGDGVKYAGLVAQTRVDGIWWWVGPSVMNRVA